MIQGTMSNVGKSLLTAGLCRIFAQDGYRTAPFKSQNMALNSFITPEGLEIGRAQAMQAEAAGITPSVLMNPILLKPTTDMGSQVIINGTSIGNMPAREYFRKKREYAGVVKEAFDALSAQNDIVVIEGAGSPAEINLKQDDIVNMGMAKIADAPVLLAGDIDRGGVFAQLYGTVMLLEEEERARIKGFLINKFRGDVKILEPGLDMISEKCNVPVLGVIPYMDVEIDDEDSLAGSLEGHRSVPGENIREQLDIAVIRLPRISNFTDFQPFLSEECVRLRYVEHARELGRPDLIIVPGSKNTMRDLLWMRSEGLEAAILRAKNRGTMILGICGGYQMLGETIEDPHGVESGGSMRGMEMLPVRTVFEEEKTRVQAEGIVCALNAAEGIINAFPDLARLAGARVRGYEIHNGHTLQEGGAASAFLRLGTQSGEHFDGCICGNVIGTFLHGIFDEDSFRTVFLEMLCDRKGISYHDRGVSYSEFREKQYDKLADTVRESVNMDEIYKILEIV